MHKYPLMRQQEGLWVEWKMHPENTSYNTCVQMKLRGDLQVERFQTAIRETLNFFDSLRVYFVEEEGVPYQFVEERGEFTLEYFDVSDGKKKETKEIAAHAKKIMTNKLCTPIDLKKFPIYCSILIKVGATDYYFLAMVPHIISDGVSAISFLEAVSVAYNKGKEGLIVEYADSKKTLVDYFEYEKNNFDKRYYKEAENYWRENLKGAKYRVDFGRKNQVPEREKAGKRVYFDLTPESSKALKKLAKSNRTTLFIVFAACFNAFLYRYFGEKDILTGYPVNIRPRGFKNFFGFFINTIPIRTQISADLTFSELMESIKFQRNKDKKYQEYPAMDLVRLIRGQDPQFDGNVFNTSVVQTVSRFGGLDLDNVQAEPITNEYIDVNEDLILSYELLQDNIGLWLEYRSEIFDDDFAQQLMKHLHIFIDDAAANPEKRIDEIKIMDDVEQRRILQDFNQTDTGYKKENSVIDFFEAQVAKTPNNAAIIFEGKELSYAQVNERANKLARYLQAYFPRKNTDNFFIGVYMERSFEQIIALLALLKLGAAYIPLDPDYPLDRVNNILADSKPELILTEKYLKDKNGEQLNISSFIWCEIDQVKDDIDQQGKENLNIEISPDDLMYVMFTSGSTGKPKGVQLSHDNICVRNVWFQEKFSLLPQDMFLQNTVFSFDISVCEIFWPLSFGAKILLVKPGGNKDTDYLVDLIETYKPTVAGFVPSMLSVFLSAMKGDVCQSIKYMLSDGEILPFGVKQNFYQKFPKAELYNLYGITEVAVHSTCGLCDKNDMNHNVTVGKPMGDTSVYILSDKLKPQPIGVIGEVYKGGRGVAKGYLNMPEMTAERFIKNPFKENDIIYKTGDLARFRENGDIEFIGRVDSQVKIRGHRIELGEIETTLLKCVEIKEVAVKAVGENTEKRLVCYTVFHVGKKLSVEELKKNICVKLPSYMMPSFFVTLAEMPYTGSGKINYKLLPKPELLLERKKPFQAASNELEDLLVHAWAEVLKMPADKISVHDSFFELGGDSLMAIQLQCKIEQFGYKVKVNDLFENYTIAKITEIAKPFDATEIDNSIVLGKFPLLPRQEQFFAENFADKNFWHRVVAFNVKYPLKLDKLQLSITEVLKQHDGLRVYFEQTQSGDFYQSIAADSVEDEILIHKDVSDIFGKKQESEILRIVEYVQRSFCVTKFPLIKIIHFDLGKRKTLLVAVIHHLLTDMVSARVILEDLFASYMQLIKNESIIFAPKTTSVKEYAEKISIFAEENNFEEEISYWQKKIAKKSINLPIIQNVTEADNIEKYAEKSSFNLSKRETETLLTKLPQLHNVKINEVIIATLSSALAEWCRAEQNEVVPIFLPTHARGGIVENVDLSRTVGWLNLVYPAFFSNFSKQTDLLVNAQQVRQELYDIPAGGKNYQILKYKKKIDSLKNIKPEIFFNYVSQIDSMLPGSSPFSISKLQEKIKTSAPENNLIYKLYIEAAVIEKRLHIFISHSNLLFSKESISILSANVKNKLKNILYKVKKAA